MTCTPITSCFGLGGNHGTETGGRSRSGVNMEIYNNTYIIPASSFGTAAVETSRGGAGLYFNNHTQFGTGAFGSTWLSMALYRTVYAAGSWGACGGLNSLDPYDQNDNTVYYGPATATVTGGVPSLTFTVPTSPSLTMTTGSPYTLYDITQGTGFFSEIQSISGTTIVIAGPTSESSWYDGGAGGVVNGDSVEIIRATICIDQEGRSGPSTYLSGTTPSPTGYPSEQLTPVYQWGDTSTGGFGIVSPSGAGSLRLIQGRDYFAQTKAQTAQTGATSPFNGTLTCAGSLSCGVGWGTLANRPTTCTANSGGGPYGVGYWETDHGQLDFCVSTNTWSTLASSPSSYVPYTDPHPLDGGVAPSPPAPAAIMMAGEAIQSGSLKAGGQ